MTLIGHGEGEWSLSTGFSNVGDAGDLNKSTSGVGKGKPDQSHGELKYRPHTQGFFQWNEIKKWSHNWRGNGVSGWMCLRGRKSSLYSGSNDPVERHYLITEENEEHPWVGQSRKPGTQVKGAHRGAGLTCGHRHRREGRWAGVNLWKHLLTSSISSVRWKARFPAETQWGRRC